MFKYNELSDLLTGELVTPIKKTPEGVLCIDKDGNQVIYSISNFDFNKSPEERIFIVEDSSDDSSDDIIPDDSSDDSSDDIPANDSSDDSSEEDEPVNNQSETNKSHWVTDPYVRFWLAKRMGIPQKSFRSMLVWEE